MGDPVRGVQQSSSENCPIPYSILRSKYLARSDLNILRSFSAESLLRDASFQNLFFPESVAQPVLLQPLQIRVYMCSC